MATPRFHLSLLLLILASLLPSTHAAASHSHLHHHYHHHRSGATLTATSRIYTAPSMHQNHIESEETRQSLRVLDPFFTPVAAQAPSGEEALAAEEEHTPLGPPQQAPSPPPSFVTSADLPSLAPPQLQAEGAGWSAQESEAAPPPPVDEPAATTTKTTIPLPTPYGDAASPPPPPVHATAPGMVTSSGGDDLGLQQLAKVLASLGYNEMASAATLLADSPSIATWPGAITVFAAPDVFLQASCPGCSRRDLLLDHMALGYFPYAELAAAPTVKLPSASVGFCLDVVSQRGPFSVHYASLYVDSVEVSHPELYDDGRYVVHGLHGFVPPLSHASCVEGSSHHHQVDHRRRHHHLSARSATTSAATAASIVRIMIRDAISRLRDSGFGFVALAMRVKFAELEKLSNLTVFALDDQAIFTGGGHGYVSAVRFHIIPGHRLTRADLLRLRPGTVLPTLAGEEQKLVITQGAGSATDEVRINYIPVKEPDVAINSRVAVHGIYVPFPRLHGLANLAASAIQMNSNCGVEGPIGDCTSTAMASATVPAGQSYGEGQ
ncbi:hypothetical protein U9M48_016749 [Paspalum notatum var. saurae]|uniref:FAS1 domain-containing protein n=1 Tax=Paspalum notatum var. saurae TaxID=547442 RepID=A0AAQ3WNI0_PASNO